MQILIFIFRNCCLGMTNVTTINLKSSIHFIFHNPTNSFKFNNPFTTSFFLFNISKSSLKKKKNYFDINYKKKNWRKKNWFKMTTPKEHTEDDKKTITYDPYKNKIKCIFLSYFKKNKNTII